MRIPHIYTTKNYIPYSIFFPEYLEIDFDQHLRKTIIFLKTHFNELLLEWEKREREESTRKLAGKKLFKGVTVAGKKKSTKIATDIETLKLKRGNFEADRKFLNEFKELTGAIHTDRWIGVTKDRMRIWSGGRAYSLYRGTDQLKEIYFFRENIEFLPESLCGLTGLLKLVLIENNHLTSLPEKFRYSIVGVSARLNW